MSGAARANKVKVDVVKPMESPSMLHVNMKKHAMKGEVGKKIHFKGHGTVTAMNQDEYGHTMKIEVEHVEHKKGGKEHGEEQAD